MKPICVYKLIIDADDTNPLGVVAVALVDYPAIERNWQTFTASPQKFKVQDADRRIVSGPLMMADLPIYRYDPHTNEEYYVVFDKPTIEKIAQKFFRQGNTGQVNLMHDQQLMTEGIYLFESFLIDSSRGIGTPKGFDKLPEGSWFGSYKVDNEQVWQAVKAGTFRGFSVEGLFDMKRIAVTDEQVIETLIGILS